MTLTVLNVAYPFAPVGPDAVGGAEQILTYLDAALVRAGYRSVVVACEGSQVCGTHVSVPRVGGILDDRAMTQACERHRHAISVALQRWRADVVHLHGVDFHHYLPRPGPATLVTLHLPVDWYPREALAPQRPDTWFNCVSRIQQAACRPNPRLLGVIENGVSETFFRSRHAKRRFALLLTRICPEKGVHLAIEAARRAGVPLLICGTVFAYGAHQDYFRREVLPRLDRWRRFVGPVGLARKRRLLAAARCLLVPSLAEETSSLVAREALASDTPVIAFKRGALAETIEHGRTGYLVEDEREMARAICDLRVRPDACREVARARFRADVMTRQYLAAYRTLSMRPRRPTAPEAA